MPIKKKRIRTELEETEKEIQAADNSGRMDLVFLLLQRYNDLKMKESVILFRDESSISQEIQHLEHLRDTQKALYKGRDVIDLMDASMFKKNLLTDLEKTQKEILNLQRTLSVFANYEL